MTKAMSDILTASGNKICSEIPPRRPRGEAWSSMRWPNEQLTTSNMELWPNAMLSICPSQIWTTRVGQFIGPTHRVWKWFWNSDASTLHRIHENGNTEDVFVAGRKPNRAHYSHSQDRKNLCMVCSGQPILEGEHWRLLLIAPTAGTDPVPTTFLAV